MGTVYTMSLSAWRL